MRCRLAVGLALAALSTPLAGPARAAPAAHLAVVLDTIEPRVLTTTSKLTLQGTITTDRSVSGLHVALFDGPPLRSRAALHAARDDGVTSLVRTVPQVAEDVLGGRRATRARSVRFKVQVPVPALRLDADQVSSLSVVVTDGAGEQGRADTFLPYFPDTLQAPPQVSLVLPLTADPTGDPTPLPHDDQARLEAAVAAAVASRPDATHSRSSSVDLAIDPAVLPRMDSALTSALRTAAETAGVSLQSLPYADSDLDALSAAGDPRAVFQRISSGPPAIRTALGVPTVASEPLLPPGGVLTARTLAQSGAHTMVLDGVIPSDVLASTTASALTVVDRTRTLVTDPELQHLLTAADTGAPTPRMAEQAVLAETALIAAEAPNALPVRAVVLLAPRRWSASPGFAQQLVRDLAAVPWLAPTPIATMLQGTTVPRSGALPTVDAQALPARGIDDGDRLRQGAGTIGALFGGSVGATKARTLDSYIDASESAAWRQQPETAVALRAVVDKEVRTDLAGVKVEAHSSQLLTGSTGTVPVTVTNTLPNAVTIVLHLSSGGTEGSRIKASASVRRTIAGVRAGGVPAHQQIPLPISSRGAGRFPVTLSVETTTHVPLPPSGRTISIRSSNLGVVSVAITITALAVLVIALAFRAVRGLLRIRARRRGPPPAGRHRADPASAITP